MPLPPRYSSLPSPPSQQRQQPFAPPAPTGTPSRGINGCLSRSLGTDTLTPQQSALLDGSDMAAADLDFVLEELAAPMREAPPPPVVSGGFGCRCKVLPDPCAVLRLSRGAIRLTLAACTALNCAFLAPRRSLGGWAARCRRCRPTRRCTSGSCSTTHAWRRTPARARCAPSSKAGFTSHKPLLQCGPPTAHSIKQAWKAHSADPPAPLWRRPPH